MSSYIRIQFTNIEPLRIADDNSSQSGQTDALSYVPGSTLRGVAINSFLKERDFEDLKNELLSNKVRFLNAYPIINLKALIPSIKGFYEDKIELDGNKHIESVVTTGNITPGYKRAGLGSYCFIDRDSIHYTSIDYGSDMKINLGNEENVKRNVFRNQYMWPGYHFVTYIAFDDDKYLDRIMDRFGIGSIFYIGNGRSAGLGKCCVEDMALTKELPYYEYSVKENIKDIVYMYCLSDIGMLNMYGEESGIDLQSLQELLQVENLQVERCSTSVTEIRGYNRKWGCRVPSSKMYQAGSVFRLRFDGELSITSMENIQNQGIGIRRNEGFGRIIFLRDYEGIKYKCEINRDIKENTSIGKLTCDDKKVLKIVAQGLYKRSLEKAIDSYILNRPLKKGKIKNSQLGAILSLANAYYYDSQQAKKSIEGYLTHALEKDKNTKQHKEQNSRAEIAGTIGQILDTNLDKTLGMENDNRTIMTIHKSELINQDEEIQYKLKIIIGMIKFYNRKEKSN